MSRFIVASTVSALLLVVMACGSRGESRAYQVTGTAEAFMQALADGRWDDAFRRLHETRQAECRSAARLGELVDAAGERPAAWVLREPRVRAHTAFVTGQVIRKSGEKTIVELALDRLDDEWTITAWSASNRELCLEARETSAAES